MNGNAMAYEWFRNLIQDEIKDELGTISNERCWENGGHESNIEAHEKYIEILKEAYEKVIGEKYDPNTVNAR